jgi:pyruvate/2-oxoglutarate dehydrogenase complex dihydrolipoamide acyltransferase (E2) component
MNRRIFPITMPKWGIEMQQGTVTGWHVAVGASTQRGDHLLDVETEKIVNSVEAPVGGTLRLILADTGATENVGALIGVIADASVPEAELRDFVRQFTPADASFEPAGGQLQPTEDQAPATPSPAEPTGGDTRVSPIARRIAERLGVDISKIKGTGRGGRISKEDVEAYAAAHSAGAIRSGAPDPSGRDGAARRRAHPRQTELHACSDRQALARIHPEHPALSGSDRRRVRLIARARPIERHVGRKSLVQWPPGTSRSAGAEAASFIELAPGRR